MFANKLQNLGSQIDELELENIYQQIQTIITSKNYQNAVDCQDKIMVNLKCMNGSSSNKIIKLTLTKSNCN